MIILLLFSGSAALALGRRKLQSARSLEIIYIGIDDRWASEWIAGESIRGTGVNIE
jgi:hypothetical protein